MKTSLLFAFAALPFCLFSQTEKGAQPVKNPKSEIENPKSTRAVVVGISDYQSPQITDLQFADRDAEEFSDWLKSAAGGSVAAENIVLLTNSKATNGRISTALYWLLDESKAGDQAIFYFSGHGDVEAKIRSQAGFLLAHDSPPTNYIGSAVNLRDVQDIVSTLSVETKARVTIITDACHAGKLAGSSINGTQATALALRQQFANEVKIMSCQPEEFSLEGKQWGDGRGAFSYFLLDGMTGEADKNADGQVSLFEIGRFLEDKVPAETAPHPQMPLTVGDRNAVISSVNQEALLALRERRPKEGSGLLATKSKGFFDGLLPEDSVVYAAFLTAIDSGFLLAPAGRCAEHFFAQLIDNERVKSHHGLLKRNFAAALIDEVQQALNALLESDPQESNRWHYDPQRYADFPAQLGRAAELLGEKHFMRKSLLSKKRFFEAYLLARSLGDRPKTARDSILLAAKTGFLEAAAIEPTAAYIFYAIGGMFAWADPPQTDTLVRYMEMALERSPAWVLPCLDIAYEWTQSLNDLEKSDQWLTRALAIDPDSYVALERLSWLRQWQNRTDESLALSQKMIDLRPELFNAYATKGVTHFMRKEYDQAEFFFKKGMELNPASNGNWAFNYFIFLLGATRRTDEALAFGEKMVNDPANEPMTKSVAMFNMLPVLFEAKKFDLLESHAERLEAFKIVGPHTSAANTYRGRAKMMKGETEAGLQLIRKETEIEPVSGYLWIILNEIEAIAAAQKGQFARADSLFRVAIGWEKGLDWMMIRIERSLEHARFHYGQFLLQQNRDAEARAQFETGMAEEPLGYYPFFGMAILSAKKGDRKAALDWLEKSLDRWLPTRELIEKEPLFSKIRKSKRFGDLMEKHFPSDSKKD